MIHYFVLATEITVYEALAIREKMALNVISKEEAFTKAYASRGITKLGIWIDLGKILSEPRIKNCTLNVTVSASPFCQSGILDVDKLLTTLNSILSVVGMNDVIWKLQNISFTYTIYGPYARGYVKLLNAGYSLETIGAKKEVDNKKQPKELKVSMRKAVLKFCYDGEEDCLQISLWLLKKKLEDMSEKYGVPQRRINEFSNVLSQMEWYLWFDYLKRIAGEGHYYSFKQVETIIDSTKSSRIEKENMKNVLKGIALYKGIEPYLSHVTDAEPRYECMQTIRTKDTAKKYIAMLSKAGINPVGISRCYAAEYDVHYVPNLITLLKEEDITRFRKLQKRQEMILQDMVNTEWQQQVVPVIPIVPVLNME